MSTLDISGRWTMNKTLSDDTTDVLTHVRILLRSPSRPPPAANAQQQGVGWLTRNAIYYSTLTLDVKHYKDDAGTEHIDIRQTLTGSVGGTTERRTLDWAARSHRDHLFGSVVGQSRRVTDLSIIGDAYLENGWDADGIKDGVVESYVVNEENGWSARQIWGFEVIKDEKRYVRHLRFEKDDIMLEKKMAYDYVGPVPAV